MSEAETVTRGSRSVRVEMLARVEGEGGIHVRVRNGEVAGVKLDIFEPPRFFEAFLRGRAYSDAPDFTARICGICPVAYQMSAVHAIERAFGVTVSDPVRALRRLLYCGEWIESHALHVYMLHAPDFLGYESGLHMAKDHGAIVERGLKLKQLGNAIVTRVGGREIHPINVKVGGFWKTPARAELDGLVEPLKRAREASLETVRWVSTFEFPDFERDYEFVALRHADEYPLCEGRLVSSRGGDLDPMDYEGAYVEEHVPHSNALHSRTATGGRYFVGPLARFALNADRLSPLAREAAAAAGLTQACRNPFRSIVVRAVELVWACDEALRLIASYEPPAESCATFEPRAGRGCGISEAPRGILYHRYDLAEDGAIQQCRIVPPTAQNLGTIEDDLGAFVGRNLALDDARLTWKCEQAVRNYDPCISCATHFLQLDRDGE
jgi:coenzyme F420-reducing hydrogenase alpha subunit